MTTASEDHESVATPAPKPKRFLGMRHLQVALIFLGMMIAYTLRVNLSVAIVAMVDKEGANPDYPEYDWDTATQAIILSGFSWGYFVLQVPAGLLSERFGPKLIIGVAQFVTAFFSIMTPLGASEGSWGVVFTFRFMQGLGQGMLFPATHVLLAKWVPVQERGTLVTLAYAGGQLGTVLALPLCGTMSTGSGGWPSVFYWFGGIGVAWTFLWILLGADSPAKDRYISDEERAYIQDSLRTNENTSGKRLATPWKAMMTSLPVWAIVVANCGWGWGFWTLLTEMPTFMKTVLGYDLNANGLLSALPYLVMFLLAFVFSIASDVLTNRKILSVTASRKLFNTIGSWVPAAALIGLSYATDNTLANVLLSLAIGVNAAIYVGFNINHIDLAPNFAGTMYGVANGLGNFISCFGPLVVGAIVVDDGSTAQWQIVFFIAAAVYFFTGVFYLVFASGELQQWNDPPKEAAHAQESGGVTTISADVM